MMKTLLPLKQLFFCILGLNLFLVNAQDTIRPVITINPSSPSAIELNCTNTPYLDPGASAFDNLEGDITSRIVVKGNVNTRRIGTYHITYFVMDTSGNSATAVRTVSVADTKGGNGFKMDSLGNDFYCYTNAITRNRYDYNWYIDGNRIKGFVDVNPSKLLGEDTLQFYHADSLSHEIRLDQYYCNNDTMISVKKMIGGRTGSLISGYLYVDDNKNCNRENNETGVYNSAVRLYDSANQQIAFAYTLIDGSFAFRNHKGNIKLLADTAGLPVVLNCANKQNDTVFQMGYGNQIKKTVDFGFVCTNAFDITAYCGRFSFLRPGLETLLSATILDNNNWRIKGKCSQKVACRVKLQVQGLIKYVGVGYQGLKPDTINGNTFTYLIDDVAKLNPNPFKLKFVVDTSASLDDTIITTLSVFPQAGDLNAKNNVLITKQTVRNSYDPNYKEVFPAQVKPVYSDWLNYTVHFQNTGNDSAIMIRLRDTLSPLLDLETFELLGSSHQVETALNGNTLMFFYRNIKLPDSATNPIGSQGFVQYRIKPKKNLTEGTSIPNKAFIYFDYNTPIITNTAHVDFKTPQQNALQQINYLPQLSIYPNPGTGLYTIKGTANSSYSVFNIYGQVVSSGTLMNDQHLIDLRNLANGFYVMSANGWYVSFIKQ